MFAHTIRPSVSPVPVRVLSSCLAYHLSALVSEHHLHVVHFVLVEPACGVVEAPRKMRLASKVIYDAHAEVHLQGCLHKDTSNNNAMPGAVLLLAVELISL